MDLEIQITPPSPPYFEGRFSNGLVGFCQDMADAIMPIPKKCSKS
ncbi:hypothetical protein H1P_770002 [Hyella patelloides LEGE 07179]|uniref:Uncharacterized protein n=1 Tax=Hyella patelloides LEGE 07179 TaxID=945734 RepID=A0A563W3X3_9CYAN|nr:hypothetical protein H1P_770002 [Hyella patelloides LEGE 07179]